MPARVVAYLAGLLRFRRVRAEVDDERCFHVDQRTDAYAARGMSRAEARRAALADLGGLTQTSEAVREVRLHRLEPARGAEAPLRKRVIFLAVIGDQ